MLKHLSHKKAAMAIGAVTLVALLLVGTFAWSAALSALNEFVGTGPEDGIVLHDDFDHAVGNKDVYVENIGEKVLFVRLMLDEYMDLTTKTAPDVPEWKTHKPAGADMADCGQAGKWDDSFHDFFEWEMGGRKWFLPSTKRDVVCDNNDYDPDGDYYAGLTDKEKQRVKQTAAFSDSDNPIIPISEYVEMSAEDQKKFIGWVYDLEDGFVYWSQPMFPDDVTGMLLDQVNVSDVINGTDYYYAINVKLEAVDVADLGMWLEGNASILDENKRQDEASENGKVLLGVLSEKIINPVSDVPVSSEPDSDESNPDEPISGEPVSDESTPDESTPDVP